MDSSAPSLVTLGLAIVCEACEAEVDLLDDDSGTGLCRHCGIAFLLDVEHQDRAAS